MRRALRDVLLDAEHGARELAEGLAEGVDLVGQFLLLFDGYLVVEDVAVFEVAVLVEQGLELVEFAVDLVDERGAFVALGCGDGCD